MEVLLSFILSTQVGLTVYAVMKYREMLAQLESKSHLLITSRMELQDAIANRNSLTEELVQIQKDIQTLKIKTTLGSVK